MNKFWWKKNGWFTDKLKSSLNDYLKITIWNPYKHSKVLSAILLIVLEEGNICGVIERINFEKSWKTSKLSNKIQKKW